MVRLALVTSNCASRERFFRAGGVRFIADILPYLSKHYDVDLYVAGAEDSEFEYRGATVHIVKSRKIPFVDKRLLPRLNLDSDIVIFLDYVAALSPVESRRSAVVFHHLAQSFHDENPVLYRRYFGRIGSRYRLVENFLLRRVFRRTRFAFAVSDVTLPYLTRLGFSVDVVGNGIDTARYVPGKKEDYAVVVGRLVNYKRVEWAVDVAKRTGIALKVVGTGPMEPYLRRIAPNNVAFLGYLEEDDKVELLSRARYLFAFSAFEGFDIPVIEAMACGAVPIVSDIHAHRYVLGSSGAGIFVRSVDDAVRAVRRLEDDADAFKSLSRRAREYAALHWDARVVAGRYLSALSRIFG